MIKRFRSTPPAQVIRYLAAGALVALVNITTMTVMVAVLGIDAQISLVSAYVASVTLHFTLQHRFVWATADGYHLGAGHQTARYLALSSSAYLVNAASLAIFPGLLGVSDLSVYFATIVVITLFNFLVLQNWIFHPPSNDDPESTVPDIVAKAVSASARQHAATRGD